MKGEFLLSAENSLKWLVKTGAFPKLLAKTARLISTSLPIFLVCYPEAPSKRGENALCGRTLI